MAMLLVGDLRKWLNDLPDHSIVKARLTAEAMYDSTWADPSREKIILADDVVLKVALR